MLPSLVSLRYGSNQSRDWSPHSLLHWRQTFRDLSCLTTLSLGHHNFPSLSALLRLIKLSFEPRRTWTARRYLSRLILGQSNSSAECQVEHCALYIFIQLSQNRFASYPNCCGCRPQTSRPASTRSNYSCHSSNDQSPPYHVPIWYQDLPAYVAYSHLAKMAHTHHDAT